MSEKTPEQVAAEKAANNPNDSKDNKNAEKPDSEKSYEELKAEAEAAEAELKAAKGGQNQDELKANMIRRRDKAKEKAERSQNGESHDDDDKPNTSKKSDIAVEDLVTLEVKGIERNSEEAKILQKYVKAGIVGNYKEALNHVGAKAELDALHASKNAATVIDENDTSENQLKTKKEVIAQYKASGEVPTDPKLRKAIVDENLKEMGL